MSYFSQNDLGNDDYHELETDFTRKPALIISKMKYLNTSCRKWMNFIITKVVPSNLNFTIFVGVHVYSSISKF